MNKKLGHLLHPSVGLFFVLMIGFSGIALAMQYYLLAIVEFSVTAVLLIIYLISRKLRKKDLQKYLHKELEGVTAMQGSQPPFPMVAIRMEDQVIVYANEPFSRITGLNDTLAERTLTELLPHLSLDWLDEGRNHAPDEVIVQKRRYRAYGTQLSANDPRATRLAVLYLTDLTELHQVREEYIRSRPVTAIILVDNYEELTKNMAEGAVSTLDGKLNDVITEWTSQYNGLLRRLARNRFLLIFEKRDLAHVVGNKFSLLEQIHEVTSPSGLQATISMGVGVDAETYAEGYEYAALAIEMALARGGDQAVIKNRLDFDFYGGRTKEADYRSKVRSRTMAGSLMELISQSSQVFIMGHRNADLDAIGAAAGVVCLCRKKGKESHIILDQEENAAAELIEKIRNVPEYKGVFISGQDALFRSDARSLLVVVDTNRPDQVENRHLLESISSRCVIDHHLRAPDYISPVLVNLHETGASSASELVTELLQYEVEKEDVLPIEAVALLAGIFLDTKSFHVRTGENTFEAAAYLRQLGAETLDVKLLLQNSFHDTMSKYQIVKAARMYRQEVAIAALNATTTRALAAQAADEMLNITGITSAFVLYPDGDRVNISARSIGKLSMQLILEPLGGGGNGATAGAQVKGNIKDVLDELVRNIDKYLDK